MKTSRITNWNLKNQVTELLYYVWSMHTSTVLSHVIDKMRWQQEIIKSKTTKLTTELLVQQFHHCHPQHNSNSDNYFQRLNFALAYGEDYQGM